MLWDDTAASIATDPTTGDQYLGFAVRNPSNTSTTAVYTMTYQASASSAPWTTIAGQLWTYSGAVYVKSALQQVTGTNPFPTAYMFINTTADSGELAFLSAPTLETGTTSYSLVSDLNAPSRGPGQSYANPRIETPEYSPLTTVPVWEQWADASVMGSYVYSLVYWNDVPN
jgi:hypothetical protein